MRSSQLEIELPRRWVQVSLWLLAGTGLIWLGALVSPVGEDSRPRLLSPRLAGVSEYRRMVRAWVEMLDTIDVDITHLLAGEETNLLRQNQLAERARNRLENLSAEIDRANVPPTFEPVHTLIDEVTQAYMECANQVAAWIAEPVDANRQKAQQTLQQANALLARLRSNPWIEVNR